MKTRLLVRWSAALGWMGLIFYLSSRPSSLPSVVPDYIPHFAAYVILALLLLRALRLHPIPGRGAVALALLITVLYAASDELHQAFVPTRTASLQDFLVDTLAAVSVAIYGNMKAS
jgi:VanZ family protein